MARNPLIRKNPPKLPTNTLHKSAGILDDHAIRKNVATLQGTISETPVNDIDIANKKYVDDEVNDLMNDVVWEDAGATIQLKLLFQSKDLDLNNQIRITEMEDPIDNQDAATKKYVDDNDVDGLWEVSAPYTQLITRDDLLIQGTDKVYFRDSGIFMYSVSDGDFILECDGDMFLRGNNSTTLGVAGDTVIGDGSERDIYPDTDLKINLGTTSSSFNDFFVGGDIIMTDDGGGLCFGEIYVEGNSTADTVATATNTQMNRFDTNGEFNNTTPQHTSDHIIIDKAGKYLVTISISFSGDPSVDWAFSLYKNNGATQYANVHCNRKLGAGGDIGSASMSGICDFAATDTVELWMQHAAGVNKDITVQDCTMSVVQVGG